LPKNFQKSILQTFAQKVTTGYQDFDIADPRGLNLTDPALQNSWVNIAINIRARNLARPTLRVYKGAKEVVSGPVFNLFTSPSLLPGEEMSMSALIWLSSMWFDIEGEFFWWFGGQAGFPTEIHVLEPRRMEFESQTKKWFFNTEDGKRVPMNPEEFLHIYEPNPWNKYRGVPPLIASAMELEHDMSVNKEVLKRLNSSAIPQGILKTDQRITPQQADDIQKNWDSKYGRSKADKRIAVLGQGTSFQALNEDLMQYTKLIENNRVTILTRYGIPLKVANATTEKTALSGKDSNEQYVALWSQTLIPLQKFWTGEMKTKLFDRYGMLNYHVEFDNSEIPELQEQEADLHKRLREDIAAGLLTPNEARELIRYDPVPDGDTLRVSGGNANVDNEAKPDDESDRRAVVSFPQRKFHKGETPGGSADFQGIRDFFQLG
jgi:HK97 family phage portal protein